MYVTKGEDQTSPSPFTAFHRPRLIQQQWLRSLKLKESDVGEVCVLHFPNQDFKLVPCLDLGKRFRSPKKMLTKRGQRAAKHNSQVSVQTARQLTFTPSVSPSRF